MTIVKICKTKEEFTEFDEKYNMIDWIVTDDGNITVAGYEYGIEMNQNNQEGFCKHCKEYKDKFLNIHENVYCKLNLNKNKEYIAEFKLKEKTRLSRRVICCCGENIGYSSLSKHRLTKYHTNMFANNTTYTEM